MSLLKLVSAEEALNTRSGPREFETIECLLGEADFGLVCETTRDVPEKRWRWATDFPGMVETENGADTYEGEQGSQGYTATREEAIAVLERKAQRFLDYIGCVPNEPT